MHGINNMADVESFEVKENNTCWEMNYHHMSTLLTIDCNAIVTCHLWFVAAYINVYLLTSAVFLPQNSPHLHARGDFPFYQSSQSLVPSPFSLGAKTKPLFEVSRLTNETKNTLSS